MRPGHDSLWRSTARRGGHRGAVAEARCHPDHHARPVGGDDRGDTRSGPPAGTEGHFNGVEPATETRGVFPAHCRGGASGEHSNVRRDRRGGVTRFSQDSGGVDAGTDRRVVGDRGRGREGQRGRGDLHFGAAARGGAGPGGAGGVDDRTGPGTRAARGRRGASRPGSGGAAHSRAASPDRSRWERD